MQAALARSVDAGIELMARADLRSVAAPAECASMSRLGNADVPRARDRRTLSGQYRRTEEQEVV